MSKPLSNHIEEYFVQNETNKEILTSKELFRAEKEDVDIKTDINLQEIILINKLIFNNRHLKKHKLKGVYDGFIDEYLRLKISLDRKSRGEFVTMNSKNNTDQIIDKMSSVSNIIGTKK